MFSKNNHNKVKLQELHDIHSIDSLESNITTTNKIHIKSDTSTLIENQPYFDADIFHQLNQNNNEHQNITYISHDLDLFYKNIYDYFVEGGLNNIILNRLLNVFILFITNIFIVSVFTYIEWDKLLLDCKYLPTSYISYKCTNIYDYINYNNTINPLIILFNILSTLYISVYIYNSCKDF